MKITAILLAALLTTSPAMAQTTAPGTLLAGSPDNAGTQAHSLPPASPSFIQVKQAVYGPFWGKYRSLQEGMLTYCGNESRFCEVYCPKSHKTCFVVYSCGEHVTKSLEARSGEMIVMDCRSSALGVAH